MPKLKKPATKAVPEKKSPTAEYTKHEFRDMLKERIAQTEGYKSIRQFAIDHEEALGYPHSNVVTALTTNSTNPSGKIINAVAKYFGISFTQKKVILTTYVV